MSSEPAVGFNPFDPAFRADPYPFYAALRDNDPVHRTPFGIVVLTRYDDVLRTLREPIFSRDIEASADTGDGGLFGKREMRSRPRTKSMLSLDPPDHTRLRSLVTKAFTPRAVDKLRPRIEQLVDDALDLAEHDGTIELVGDLAFPVPFEVISELLDMPTDRSEELREWSQALTQALEPACTPEQMQAAERAGDLIAAELLRVIDHRRGHLGDDVLSGLIAAEEAGDRLTTEELVSTVLLLYVAGHETTVNLIGNSVLALLRHPEQQELWRADPSVANRAIDELLRFDGPVQLTMRVPLEDVRYGEVEVASGTPVMTVLGAANHDPSVFDEPDELLFDRPNANKHLGFAAGIHYCLGSALARAETQVAVGRLLERFKHIELVGEPHWRDRLTIRGVDELRLLFR